MSHELDQTLVTTIKDGCRGHVLKDLISMGGNVNTTLGNCLLLCLQPIGNDFSMGLNYNDMIRWELVLILLDAGICDKYRKEAIDWACRKHNMYIKSVRNSDQGKGVTLRVLASVIKNHRKPKSVDYILCKELIASSTKKAWSSLLFSKQYSDIVFVFKENKGGDKNGQVKEELLHAHRIILAASSNYFSRYSDSDWGNSKTFETSNSKLVMGVVLKFMYTGEVPSSDELDKKDFADELLAVSGEYEVEDLRRLAEESIKRKLNIVVLCVESKAVSFSCVSVRSIRNGILRTEETAGRNFNARKTKRKKIYRTKKETGIESTHEKKPKSRFNAQRTTAKMIIGSMHFYWRSSTARKD